MRFVSHKYARMLNKYVPNNQAASLSKSVTVSVVGARGYSGLELSRLLLRHPAADYRYAFATGKFALGEELLETGAEHVQSFADTEIMAHLTDVVFLATPAEVSRDLAPRIAAAGKKVIDLSGAFRMKKTDPAPWYGFPAPAAEIMAQVEYGLVPFCGPLRKTTNIVANPGCYATAINLALIPLVKHDLIETSSIVIDAKSGTSGGGRKAAENLLFSEVAEDLRPYRVGRHQHAPEIAEAVEGFAGRPIDPHMVTHLLPVRRGISAAIFARAKTADIAAIAAAFEAEYAAYPLVRHGRDIARLSNLNLIAKTPFTHISYELVDGKLYVFSVLDNLMKGAASQAIENFNRILDLPAGFSLAGLEG